MQRAGILSLEEKVNRPATRPPRDTSMDRLEILFLGVSSGTSLDRARSLARLGHQVTIIDPLSLLGNSRVGNIIHHRTGYRLAASRLERGILRRAGDRGYDLVWVDGGQHERASLVRELRERSGLVVSYCVDDPTGARDGRLWDLYLSSLPEYDLVVVVRDVNVREVKARGARHVHRVFRSFDNENHRPRRLNPGDRVTWGSDVLLVGTWMPERGPFLAELMERGVPLTIYGDRWHKAAEWRTLKSAWRGPAIWDDDYAKAIQCARVVLGLLSKGNRDRHTTRSLEVPAIGGLFCAERTSEHEALYRDGVEAVFWDDAADCAEKCRWLLADEETRVRIARGGHLKVRALRLSNDDVLGELLSHALLLRQ